MNISFFIPGVKDQVMDLYLKSSFTYGKKQFVKKMSSEPESLFVTNYYLSNSDQKEFLEYYLQNPDEKTYFFSGDIRNTSASSIRPTDEALLFIKFLNKYIVLNHDDYEVPRSTEIAASFFPYN